MMTFDLAQWAEDGGPAPLETTEHELGRVEVTKHSSRDRWGEVSDYVASATCSCGEVVRGRCCSSKSARQWLATNFHHHSRRGLPAFPVVAELLVGVGVYANGSVVL